MSFNDYKAPELTIDGITLRGITPDDLTGLVQRHGALIETWFEGEPDLLQTIRKAPALVADMIACAAGEPEAVETVLKMPIGVQLRAIAAVFKLTFDEVDMGNVFRLFATKYAGEQSTTGNRDI